MTKTRARGSSVKSTHAKSSASSGATTLKSTKKASSKSAENAAPPLAFDEIEIHKIAYLSGKGWKPSRKDPETGRYGWGIDYDDDSGREAWYMFIDDAYECQLEREKEDAGHRNS
jgi:hypothetical protein